MQQDANIYLPSSLKTETLKTAHAKFFGEKYRGDSAMLESDSKTMPAGYRVKLDSEISIKPRRMRWPSLQAILRLIARKYGRCKDQFGRLWRNMLMSYISVLQICSPVPLIELDYISVAMRHREDPNMRETEERMQSHGISPMNA